MKQAMGAGNPLGQQSDYPTRYTPALLHPMPRAEARKRVGVAGAELQRGEDLWTGYEFSWLGPSGKPEVMGLHLRVPCQSVSIVESKSVKLYLGSYAQTRFGSAEHVHETLCRDFSSAFGASVALELVPLSALAADLGDLDGRCLDDLDIQTDQYTLDPSLLGCRSGAAVEGQASVYTHLFRSLCPVTAQPDWASIWVCYEGANIDPPGLLKYLISYRTHQAFHEVTVEQIFADIKRCCAPERLAVYGRFQRRGGLDINPYRSDFDDVAPRWRTPRQ